jgi:hypothetical protein
MRYASARARKFSNRKYKQVTKKSNSMQDVLVIEVGTSGAPLLAGALAILRIVHGACLA